MILFKAKTPSGEWVKSMTIAKGTIKRKAHFMYMEVAPENWKQILPETVCQYTGLDDKNGKKIFSGDTLESKEHGNAFVVYVPSMGMYGLQSKGSEAIDFDLWLYCKNAEITGNIHDND